MKNTNFNELAKRAFEKAKAKGFHDKPCTDAHCIMLVACELAEAVEADRCGRRADRKEYERLVGACEEIVRPHLFEMYIKDSVEDELADAVIRMLDFIGMKGIDVNKKLNADDLVGEYRKTKGKGSLADEVYTIVCMLCFDEFVEYTMGDVYELADNHGIDLMWFVEEKMKYNETRDLLHGKSY